MTTKVQNPILPGFHADPSICRVGGDYYIATSTFEWFPGVRIHHSRDLVNWEVVSMPLSTTKLLDMEGVEASGGIWAPCLSYSNGLFYLIYTVVKGHLNPVFETPNYLTTAPSIQGPWSAPIYLNSSGFDPSLFHDDDGRKWLVNMERDYRKAMRGENWFVGIVLQEYDERQKKLVGKPVNIFRGTNLMCTEGPHLYKRNGWYYLMCAEAGTGYEHAETLARSRSIEGPYEVHPKNPVLTSWEGPRNGLPAGQCPRGKLYEMGPSYIKKAGHASICDTPEGRWMMVHLCGRPLPGTDCCVLGRETSIQEVEWREDDWLYLKHGGNHPMEYLELPGEIPVREELKKSGVRVEYGFESQEEFNGKFLMDFQTLRMPRDPMDINVTARPGWLRMVGRESIFSRFRQSLMARRQVDFSFRAETVMEFHPEDYTQSAGLIWRYDEDNQYYLFISFDNETARLTVNVITVVQGKVVRFETLPIENEVGIFTLGVEVHEHGGRFYYLEKGEKKSIGGYLDACCLSDDRINGAFTGAFVGICVQDVRDQKQYADFRSFVYEAQ